MNKPKNELIAEFYRKEQRQRCKVLGGCAGFVVFLVVMFLTGYFIK